MKKERFFPFSYIYSSAEDSLLLRLKKNRNKNKIFFPIPLGLIVFSKALMKSRPELLKLLVLKLYLFNMHLL